MEESLSSVKIITRRRDRNAHLSSTPIGISTRSKSRTFVHHNSSPVSRSGFVSTKLIPGTESVGAFLGLKCTDASRVSSIKDLRMKRVFTPEVNSVTQGERDEENEGSKKLKVSDAGRAMDPDVAGTVNELDKSGLVKSEVENERGDKESALNSKHQENSGNEPFSTIKTALNRISGRKVFKVSSSFSYKRMLPYLMVIAKDASGVSNIEIMDDVKSEERLASENSCAAKIECVVPHFQDSKPSENLESERAHIKKGHKDLMNCVDGSIEEHIQTTPPDPGIFSKMKFGESMVANKVPLDNQTYLGSSVGSAKTGVDALKQSPNRKFSINSMNKPVLNPCSRLRLYHNSRSLSYRRLLPFLMDASKENSCPTADAQKRMPQANLQDDDYATKIEAENSYDKHYTQDLASSSIPLPPSAESSYKANDIMVSTLSDSASSPSNLEPDVVTLEITLPGEIQQTQSSPAKSELVSELKDRNSQLEPSSVVNSDISTTLCASEEPEPDGKQKMCLDLGFQLHNRNVELVEDVKLKQNSLQVETSPDVFVSPNKRPPKGILKRNPLGCRGLCTCLNCSSFRLHADRAFEFSRNQMHNAEEVASELMEELANLRIILEKSITENNDWSGIQISQNLVKQACNKALEAEKLAKERLVELNYDLRIHSRIPALVQPSVAFSNNIQERAIPVLPCSTSKEERVRLKEEEL